MCSNVYRCKKCKRPVAIYGCSNNPTREYLFKCIPVGIGSGLYMEWLCSGCDPEVIEEYCRTNQISKGHHPWITDPI